MQIEPILSLLFFTIGTFLALKSYKIKKRAYDMGYKLFADFRTAGKDEINFITNFWLTLCTSVFLYMVASFFVVISLNLPPIDMMKAFISLIICTMGIYICIVVTLGYRERRRYECKRRVKIGFSKERLPLFLSDLVLTVLMIFLFTITHHAIKWIFLFFGIFVLIVGLIGLILKSAKG